MSNERNSSTNEWAEKMAQAREIGSVLRSLYIALGAATLLGDKELIEQLSPIIRHYRDRTREALERSPYVV